LILKSSTSLLDILDINEARDDGWQWNQLDHMQIICTSLQTENHTSILSLNFYGLGALPDAQGYITEGNSQMTK